MREVLSAGLEARLYGRHGCPPLQFKLDKFFGFAWLAAMKIPEFKPSKRFVDGIKLPCLVAQIKNSELPGIATEYRAQTRSNPYCDIYLRGKDPNKISAWQEQMLEQLFKQNGLTAAVIEGMKEFTKTGGERVYDEFDDDERKRVKKLGLAPYLRIDCVVIDEVEKEVLISADSEVGLLHEHGVTIHLSEGRWRYDDGERFDRYSGKFVERKEEKERSKWLANWKATFPLPVEDAFVETDMSPLYGVWRFDADETAKVLKQCGAPKREIDAALAPTNNALALGWYYSAGSYEWLKNGYTFIKWDVAKYERKGMLYTVHNTLDDGGDHSEIWCDGKRLMTIGGKSVYTRVKDSYRKGKKFTG
jgi:hypothetical protein